MNRKLSYEGVLGKTDVVIISATCGHRPSMRRSDVCVRLLERDHMHMLKYLRYINMKQASIL